MESISSSLAHKRKFFLSKIPSSGCKGNSFVFPRKRKVVNDRYEYDLFSIEAKNVCTNLDLPRNIEIFLFLIPFEIFQAHDLLKVYINNSNFHAGSKCIVSQYHLCKIISPRNKNRTIFYF